MESQQQERFEGWAIVELMGHNVIAGHCSEQVVGGAAMLRVDVPNTEDRPGFTKFFSPSAIYGITPTSEAHATEAAARLRVRPVSLYILPEAARPLLSDPQDNDFDEDDYSDF